MRACGVGSDPGCPLSDSVSPVDLGCVCVWCVLSDFLSPVDLVCVCVGGCVPR